MCPFPLAVVGVGVSAQVSMCACVCVLKKVAFLEDWGARSGIIIEIINNNRFECIYVSVYVVSVCECVCLLAVHCVCVFVCAFLCVCVQVSRVCTCAFFHTAKSCNVVCVNVCMCVRVCVCVV